jgi:GTPase
VRKARTGPLPLVAIVGRANVGKSTLFNRLLREHRSLVEDRPGVTRDRVAAQTTIEGREVLLVDTGGLDPEAEGTIPRAIQKQVTRIVADAAVVLFVVSAREGLLPLESWIADLLRRSGRPVVVVANKADAPAQDVAAGEFSGLGFEEILTTSAEHRRGIRDVEIAIGERLPPLPETEPELRDHTAIALIGRPNVGKSSLFNRLIPSEELIVDDVPGTTRDAIDTWLEYGGRSVALIDTAGLRRAARRADRLERGSSYFSLRAIERSDVALLIIDVTEGVTDQESRIARLALDRGRPLVLVCNKWDAVDGSERRPEIEKELERKLAFVRDAVRLDVSAKTGKGTHRILQTALQLADESRVKISTAEVNRVLHEAVERFQPPFAGRRRPHFLYATQISDRPPTILIFVNDPELVSTSYRRYLESSFRKHMGVRSAPLRIRLRMRTRSGRSRGAAVGAAEDQD